MLGRHTRPDRDLHPRQHAQKEIHSGDRESDAIDAAGLARERFALLGRDVPQLLDDQLRNLVSELERRLSDEALTSAAQGRDDHPRGRQGQSMAHSRGDRCSQDRQNSSTNSPAQRDGPSASLSRTPVCARRTDPSDFSVRCARICARRCGPIADCGRNEVGCLLNAAGSPVPTTTGMGSTRLLSAISTSFVRHVARDPIEPRDGRAEPLSSIHTVKAERAAGHHLMLRLGGQRS